MNIYQKHGDISVIINNSDEGSIYTRDP
jgi:hypothetical protein